MIMPTFKFIKKNDFAGISNKTGKPFELRKIILADPNTFENHTFNYAEDCNFNGVKSGEEVQLVLQAVSRFGGADSTVQVVEVLPVR